MTNRIKLIEVEILADILKSWFESFEMENNDFSEDSAAPTHLWLLYPTVILAISFPRVSI